MHFTVVHYQLFVVDLFLSLTDIGWRLVTALALHTKVHYERWSISYGLCALLYMLCSSGTTLHFCAMTLFKSAISTDIG